MRPFNPDPITDRNRELFGTYMRRYETPPSMSAFDALISDRRRELYGEYRSRWSSRKVGTLGYSMAVGANGTNWVDMNVTPDKVFNPTIHNVSMYQIYFSYGGWTGTPIYRILIDGQKVYPFTGEEIVLNATWMSFGSLSMNIRTGEECMVQFKSSNAADGAGQTLLMYLNAIIFE